MPTQANDFTHALAQSNEIEITVTGRKSGRSITLPIWFVSNEAKLYLLPVKGSDTQWYQNVLKKPVIEVEAKGVKAELKAAPTTDPAQVKSVIEKFRGKYGAGDVKKYYSKFDVAVIADLP